MKEFTPYVLGKYDAAIQETGDPDGALSLAKSDVKSLLQSTKTLKPFAECLRWELQADKPIAWNTNPDYTVFPNGVLQFDKRDPAYPDLPYYFGPTKPKEYVNNSLMMRHDFNCPPVCLDGHYIKQAEEWLRDVFFKIQPNAEDRRLILLYMSLAFKALNFKKMVINIGTSGNNAKSSTFECLIYILGQYGLAGDKRMLLKGPTDRVSLAELDCKRFVMFEEPDPAKSLDQEFMKDLIGGANQTTGRFNFSNKNKISLHCKTVLNANVMTTVALEQAILERLIYFIWKTRFATLPEDVDPDARIYLADEKFKTPQYWDSVVDGIIWILINHYHLFQLNNNKLMISDEQRARTRRELLEADLFIKWFESNFTMLTNTQQHQRKFISQAEIVEQFNLSLIHI